MHGEDRVARFTLLERIAGLAMVFAALVGGAWLQSRVMPSSDLGWLIRSVRLMSEGHAFGSDLFELNLPTVWFLCLPAAWGIEHLDLGELAAIRAWIWLLTAASLLLALACVLTSSCRDRLMLVEFSAAAIAVCILAGSSFGQREHFALFLSLPYMFAAQLRIAGASLPRALAIAAGTAAGIAFAIKPLFVLVPACIELAMLAILRRDWSPFRAESLAMLLAGSTCVAAVLVFAPDYVTRVLPIVFATYWAYDLPLDRVLPGYPIAIPLFIAWLAAAVTDARLARAYAAWIAAFLAWSATYFIQSRGFDYHAYPALGCAFAVTAGLVGRMVQRIAGIRAAKPAHGRQGRRWWVPSMVLVLLVITGQPLVANALTWYRAAIEADWPMSRAQTRKEFIDHVRALGIGPGDSVLSFSTHPFPAFPTVNYVGADWIGPDMAHFTVPAWLRRNEIEDPDRRRAIEAAMQIQRQHVRRALLDGIPDYLFVDVGLGRAGSGNAAGLKRIDFLGIYGADPDIAAALDRYRTIAKVRQIEILKRDDSINPGATR